VLTIIEVEIDKLKITFDVHLYLVMLFVVHVISVLSEPMYFHC
jgi:hypothetical protein